MSFNSKDKWLIFGVSFNQTRAHCVRPPLSRALTRQRALASTREYPRVSAHAPLQPTRGPNLEPRASSRVESARLGSAPVGGSHPRARSHSNGSLMHAAGCRARVAPLMRRLALAGRVTKRRPARLLVASQLLAPPARLPNQLGHTPAATTTAAPASAPTRSPLTKPPANNRLEMKLDAK